MRQTIKFIPYIILTILSLLLTSCSQKPWLSGTIDHPGVDIRLPEIIKKHSNNISIDGTAQIIINTPINHKTVNGYFAILTPDHIKFIVSSPLGQPVYILTENSNHWQLIDVLSGGYQKEESSKLLASQDMPKSLAKINLSTIITGGVSDNFQPPFIIRQDKNDRGLWYTSAGESILISLDNLQIVSRLLEYDGEKIEINYAGRQNIQTSPTKEVSIPSKTVITGLDYGAKITINLDKIKGRDISENSFLIKPPAHFVESILVPVQ
ncbi:MAG: hypothetical protein OCC45_00390 [Desulfotalea sp.]